MPRPVSPTSADRVLVGAIIGPHGVKGAVRVKSFTEIPTDVASYGPVADEAGSRLFRLEITGEAKDALICRILLLDQSGSGRPVADRNGSEALKGVRLYVPRAQLPDTEDEDEFYHADLIGLRVELRDGTEIGRVRAIFDFGAGDVLEVGWIGGGVGFLPFTKAVVPVVDVKGGRLIADPPEEVGDEPGEEGFGEEVSA